KLMSSHDARRPALIQRLVRWVNDYRSAMPSSQRLFVMTELHENGVGMELFPTYAAELLAAQALEVESVRAGAGLEASRAAGLWKLTGRGGKAVALLSTESVKMATVMLESTTGVSVEVLPPGAATSGEAIAAGPSMPGWQIGFTLLDDHALQEAAMR